MAATNYLAFQRRKWEHAQRLTTRDASPALRGLSVSRPAAEAAPAPVTRASGRTSGAHAAPALGAAAVAGAPSMHNTRQLMLAAGIGPYLVPMAQEYAFFLPRTSDPFAQGVILIVQGLQRLLNQHGARLEESGVMDTRTIRALTYYAGPLWVDRTWVQLYGDVLSGKRFERYPRRGRRQAAVEAGAIFYETGAEMEGVGTSIIGDLAGSPVPWILGGLAFWHFYLKKGSSR